MEDIKNISDEKLIEIYTDGNESAFGVLAERYLSSVCGFARGYVGDNDKAEDIAQETFVKVWKNIKTFDTKRNFRSWLFTIAKNTALDYLRHRESVPLSLLEDENGETTVDRFIPAARGLDDVLDERLLALSVAEALEDLPDKHRKIFSLRTELDLTFKDISILLKTPLNTVKSSYRRTLSALRADLGKRLV
ncbi:MAG: RNA polymerase sigma-70 factor, ECF subfamily [Parcubacteria group bacterium LiPW_15]|nr:MAG: RNA polymerase sigma-70 factor, ECF subfamily [Parcubacteria group bacterium LiPW_15]